MPSDNTIFMIILGAIILLSLHYLFNGTPIHNEGSLQMKRPMSDKKSPIDMTDNQSSDSISDSVSDSQLSTNHSFDSEMSDDVQRLNRHDSDDSESRDSESINYVAKNMAEMDDSTDSSLEIIRERAMGMNGPYFRRKNGGKFKHDSYRALGAGTNMKEVDGQFKVPDVTKNYTDRFVPMDESGGMNAPVNIPNIKGTEKDKYNVNSFMPQEKEKDWFETIETVDVKNSHLINIYRPIGADTIGSTHKYAIYDIRGLDKAVSPKFVVSPWLQSSAEPDRSSKSLCA
jgi:hypothetical protein